MDITLNKSMKIKVFLFFIIILNFSCTTTYKREKFYYRGEGKNHWINTFKEEVFYACLREGYKNDSIFKMMAKKDFFNFSGDNFDYEILDTAEVIGKRIIKNMPPPYVKVEDEVDLSRKNFISANCLRYYASRELDSIARIEYKKHLKREKETEKYINSK